MLVVFKIIVHFRQVLVKAKESGQASSKLAGRCVYIGPAALHINQPYIYLFIHSVLWVELIVSEMICKMTFSVFDPLPPALFYECIAIFVPKADGLFSTDYKKVMVIPLIKKISFDCNVLEKKNYRPIINLYLKRSRASSVYSIVMHALLLLND